MEHRGQDDAQRCLHEFTRNGVQGWNAPRFSDRELSPEPKGDCTQNNSRVSVNCARNCGDNMLLTTRAVLLGDYTDFEILIRDRSDDDATLMTH
jgi:hypothetical protein